MGVGICHGVGICPRALDRWNKLFLGESFHCVHKSQFCECQVSVAVGLCGPIFVVVKSAQLKTLPLLTTN